MAFINQAVTVLQTLVIALGAGLAVWGVVTGIRLSEKADHEIKLRLLKTQSYNGMMDLIYAKR